MDPSGAEIVIVFPGQSPIGLLSSVDTAASGLLGTAIFSDCCSVNSVEGPCSINFIFFSHSLNFRTLKRNFPHYQFYLLKTNKDDT